LNNPIDSKTNWTNFQYLEFSRSNLALKIVYHRDCFSLVTWFVKPDHLQSIHTIDFSRLSSIVLCRLFVCFVRRVTVLKRVTRYGSKKNWQHHHSWKKRIRLKLLKMAKRINLNGVHTLKSHVNVDENSDICEGEWTDDTMLSPICWTVVTKKESKAHEYNPHRNE